MWASEITLSSSGSVGKDASSGILMTQVQLLSPTWQKRMACANPTTSKLVKGTKKIVKQEGKSEEADEMEEEGTSLVS